MKTYKDWPLLEEMPDGWRIDKTAGSPLHGYEFVTDGKSIINGGKRALLRVVAPQRQLLLDAPMESVTATAKDQQPEKKPAYELPAGYARTVNELAREKFKQRLLNDILIDLAICEIEGWCKQEYIDQMKSLINSIGQKQCIDVVFSKMETTTSKMETVGT